MAYLESNLGTTTMYVETTDTAPPSSSRGGWHGDKTFNETVADIRNEMEYVISELNSLDLDEIELSAGVKLGCESSAIFWCIAKASAEANFTIKVKWKRSKGDAACPTSE